MGTQFSWFLALVNVFIATLFVQGIICLVYLSSEKVENGGKSKPKWKSYIVNQNKSCFFIVKSEVNTQNNQSKLQQKGLPKLVNRPGGSASTDKITMIGGGVQARLQKSSQHCDVIRDIMLYQLSPFKPIACHLLQTHTLPTQCMQRHAICMSCGKSLFP